VALRTLCAKCQEIAVGTFPRPAKRIRLAATLKR
jgi:hypothetical protein